MYTYDTFKPEYLEEQRNLVLTFRKEKNWKWMAYPTLDQLKNQFSGENFTPETRHYAFKDGKMVGFLNSSFTTNNEGTTEGNIQFPFVIIIDDEVEKELMKRAINTFKEKDIKVVWSNIQTHWIGADEIMSNYGFKKGDISGSQINIYSKDLEDKKISQEEKELFVEVDPVKDKDALIEVFKSEMNQSEEQIGQIIDRWADKENPANANLLFNIINKKDDKIITHSMSFKNPDGFATMTHISVYDDNYKDLREKQFNYMTQRLKKEGHERIRIFGFTGDPVEDYKFGNFNIDRSHRYELKI